MSYHEFDNNCKACMPVLADARTGKPMEENQPAMRIVRKVWEETDPEGRKAFHAVTCNNSRNPRDHELMRKFQQRLQEAINRMNIN